jgi:hypothetical protein
MKGLISPSRQEAVSSFILVFLRRYSFFCSKMTRNRTIVEVKVAMERNVMTLSSPSPILKIVGIVDQNRTDMPA